MAAPGIPTSRLARLAVAVAVVILLCGVTACQAPVRARFADTAGSPPGSLPPATTSAAAPPAVHCTRTTAPCPVPGKVIMGAYLELSGRTLTQSLALRHQQLGRYPRILHVFYSWSDPLPDSFPQLPAGSVLMVSWRGAPYASITNGSQDALIVRAARALARYGKPVYLRWAWEMNGDWYLWGGARNDTRTAGFIAAWRHVHDIFTAQHAANVAWVWGPNWLSEPDEPWNAAPNYYPGDAYVDWVAVSGYSHGRQTPDDLFDGIYAEYATRKPIMLAETGVSESGGQVKPDWIRALAAWTVEHPDVASIVWFDSDDPQGPNWRIDTSDAAVSAYRQMLDDPRFGG